ncbi:MAG: hypothetical protein P4M02_10115 [Clostridia bacterium]|nr:hypothetical protein [Clostridia bacterium]
MREVFMLWFTQLRARFGFSVMRYNLHHDKKKFFKSVGILALVVFALAEMIGVYAYLCHALYGVAASIGHPEALISLGIVAAQLMTLVFGLFYILGALFFAKDSELLASLPVKQWKVFCSKMLYVYAGELGVSLCIITPVSVIYGIGGGLGALFYLKMLLALIFLPAIPLAIASLISMLLMGVVSRTRHRDMITTVLSFVFVLAIVVGQNLFTSQLSKSGTGQTAAKLLQSGDGLIRMIGRYFPPSIWASLGVTQTGSDSAVNLLLFVGISIAAIVVSVLLAGRIYYAGSLAQLETNGRSRKQRRLSFAAGSPAMAIFMREMRILLRTPVYALNSLFTVVLGPVVLLMPMFSSGTSNSADMTKLFAMIGSGKGYYVIFALSGISLLFAMINPAASTVYSREGRTFWLSKAMPVTPALQARAKLLACYSVAAATAIMTIIAASVTFRVPALYALGAVVFSAVISLALTAVNMLIDLLRPKLEWESPQEAIKQNMNVMLGMGAGLLTIGVLAGAGWLLMLASASPELIAAAVFVLACVLSVVLCRVVVNEAAHAYRRIES